MDDSSVPIFAQAKLEYTKQLVDVLYMNMYDGIRSIYDDSKQLYLQKTTSIIYIFRSLLEKVPTWNTEIIDSETQRIMKASKCDWLDDLLTAVFISHTRILMSIGPNQNYNKINVTIPKTSTFIHKSYINIAREVWKNPYLFNEQVPGHEYQRNMKQLEDMIKLIIEDTIRRQLPIKEILREHLETYDETNQTTQKPIDMQMIMNELKKANMQTKEIDESHEPNEPQESKDIDENDDIVFNKEEDIEQSSIPESPTEDRSFIAEPSIAEPSIAEPSIAEPSIAEPSIEDEFTNQYGDPSDSQIKKATQNIIINDITEPVVEATYDNTDIITGNFNTTAGTTDTTKKLSDMMSELNKPDINNPLIDISIKPVTTDTKQKINPITSVIKIDDVKIPDLGIVTPPAPEPAPVPAPVPAPTPFSFNNLYPNLNGSGKVEDITKDEVKKDEVKIDDSKKEDITKIDVKDINASVMKEVISLDKQADEIDETITLDNFFNDVKQMTNPMEPIKEETKYTLFEDAKTTE